MKVHLRYFASIREALATGERLAGTPHRPPQLYRYNTSIDLTDQGPLSRLSAPRTLASTRGDNS